MSKRNNDVIGKLALAAGSLLVTLLALEFVVFRYILVPDDLLRNVTINSVVRYQPETNATFRHPDGRTTALTINAQGWNSRVPFYAVPRKSGVSRIAVVGDSYVHAAFVNSDDAFPAAMQRALEEKGHASEVYRFGMDGAPLSQYLHVLRKEVVKYRPDIVVVPIIHNDFDESYRFIKTRYASSFLKLSQDGNGDVVEILPSVFKSGLADKFRASAMFRYIYYETGLYLHAKRWVNKYFWGGNEDWDPEFVSSAVDVRKIRDFDSNFFFARYVVDEMQKLAVKHGFQLVLAMDGVREAIYERRPEEAYEVWQLNLIARSIAAELSVPLVELHEIFKRDFAAHRERLEFDYDWHWNVRGNDLVGKALARAVEVHLPAPETTPQSTQAAAVIINR